MDELDKTVEGLDGNPMRAYKIHFPYSVKFTLSDDDNHTQVIINTTSQEMTFARSEEDALFQKEKNDAVSKNGYTNHIINWVQERMSTNEKCELTYTDKATVQEMTDEEMEEYQREVISLG